MTTDTEITTVKVFRESALWDTTDKWWQLAAHHLRELYLGAWDVDDELVSPQQAQFICDQYQEPVVLVY